MKKIDSYDRKWCTKTILCTDIKHGMHQICITKSLPTPLFLVVIRGWTSAYSSDAIFGIGGSALLGMVAPALQHLFFPLCSICSIFCKAMIFSPVTGMMVLIEIPFVCRSSTVMASSAKSQLVSSLLSQKALINYQTTCIWTPLWFP